MPVNLAYTAYRLAWEAVDWVYPPICGGCGLPGTRWCENCSEQTAPIQPPICPLCGNPTRNSEECARCSASRPYYSILRSCAVYNGTVREAIHRFKYKNDVGMGEALSRIMISEIEKLNWSLNLVTSVPLSLVRLRERGYNQANLLARPIALFLRIPFSPKALTRIKETRTQVGLNVSERQLNMENAFIAKSKEVREKAILLVDDVATTGATLNACAKALLEAGATMVYGFSLARAIFSPDGSIDVT